MSCADKRLTVQKDRKNTDSLTFMKRIFCLLSTAAKNEKNWIGLNCWANLTRNPSTFPNILSSICLWYNETLQPQPPPSDRSRVQVRAPFRDHQGLTT